MMADFVKSYKAMGFNTHVFKGAFVRLSLRLLPRKSRAESDEHVERFHQDISTMESGTKSSGVQVRCLIIAGHLDTFHRHNVSESDPLSLFM